MNQKVPCRRCWQFGVLKRSKLTGNYWCRKCKEMIYTDKENIFIRDNLRFKDSPNFSTVLKKMQKEISKEQ